MSNLAFTVRIKFTRRMKLLMFLLPLLARLRLITFDGAHDLFYRVARNGGVKTKIGNGKWEKFVIKE